MQHVPIRQWVTQDILRRAAEIDSHASGFLVKGRLILPCAAIDYAVTLEHVQFVISGVSIKRIDARAAAEFVIALAPEERVIAFVPEDQVVATAPIDDFARRRSDEDIVAYGTGQKVGEGEGVQRAAIGERQGFDDRGAEKLIRDRELPLPIEIDDQIIAVAVEVPPAEGCRGSESSIVSAPPVSEMTSLPDPRL